MLVFCQVKCLAHAKEWVPMFFLCASGCTTTATVPVSLYSIQPVPTHPSVRGGWWCVDPTGDLVHSLMPGITAPHTTMENIWFCDLNQDHSLLLQSGFSHREYMTNCIVHGAFLGLASFSPTKIAPWSSCDLHLGLFRQAPRSTTPDKWKMEYKLEGCPTTP